ncbi:MAG: response regulator [Candidatus Sulfotelmatobacter sp.]
MARQQPAKGELGWRMGQKILIVDDNSMIRSSLRSWIEGNADWRVCGEAENGQIAVEKVETMRPDIVILDLQMPVMNGLEAARQISHVAPNTAMVMFTMHPSTELLKVAQTVGVREVVSKADQLSGPLLVALKQICAPRCRDRETTPGTQG